VVSFNLKGLAVSCLFLVFVALAVNRPDTWITHLAEAAVTVVILMSLGGLYFRSAPKRR
jgi:hypothetical protein